MKRLHLFKYDPKQYPASIYRLESDNWLRVRAGKLTVLTVADGYRSWHSLSQFMLNVLRYDKLNDNRLYNDLFIKLDEVLYNILDLEW
jgi:TATA-box binding protein (TBP) (component of TFIID and TFIIIB)